jgi:transposase-like protein
MVNLPNPRFEEQRRYLAMALLETGWSQAQVARFFAVSREAVRKWRNAYLTGGAPSLAARKRGRPARHLHTAPRSASGPAHGVRHDYTTLGVEGAGKAG